MNKRIVLGALLAMALVLAPGVSQARWMNANTGRFQTVDPYEGDQEDPQSLHRYTYAADNPVDNIDPSGNDIGEALTVIDVGGIIGQNRLPSLSLFGPNSLVIATVDVHFDRLGSLFGKAWHHAYLLLHQLGRPTIGFRGGPSIQGGHGYLTEAGSGQVFDSSFPDYPTKPEDDVAHISVSVPLKPYEVLRQEFQEMADHIESLRVPYHGIKGPNSNSFVKTLIVKNGLMAPIPPVWAPGWDHTIY